MLPFGGQKSSKLLNLHRFPTGSFNADVTGWKEAEWKQPRLRIKKASNVIFFVYPFPWTTKRRPHHLDDIAIEKEQVGSEAGHSSHQEVAQLWGSS